MWISLKINYVRNYLFIDFSLLERRGGEYFVNLSAAICLVGVGLHCAFKIEFIDKVFDKIIIGALQVPIKR